MSGLLMTLRGRVFSRSDYQQLVMAALPRSSSPLVTLPPCILKPCCVWSGKQVSGGREGGGEGGGEGESVCVCVGGGGGGGRGGERENEREEEREEEKMCMGGGGEGESVCVRGRMRGEMRGRRREDREVPG